MYGGKFPIIVVLLTISYATTDETTQHYLENTLKTLSILKRSKSIEAGKPTIRRASRHHFSDNVPPLSLTKGELAAIYEQAATKGETLKLDTGDEKYVHAFVHHIDDDHPPSEEGIEEQHHEGISGSYTQEKPINNEPTSEDSGYYYYYYPLKSFLDEMSSNPPSPDEHHSPSHHSPPHHYKEVSTYKPPYTYHSHHHQHNITIQTADKEKKEVKPLDHPIIMAISGLLGMAAMMVLSLLVMPKWKTKPKTETDVKKKSQLDDFARFALNAIEGNCAERFACELTKTARSFDMEDNRFYKLLKRVAPGTFGRYMTNPGRFANKQLQCTAIPCNKKKSANNQNRKPNNNQKKKNNPNKKF